MSKVEIFVCCHKHSPYIKSDGIYTPIHVGKAVSNIDDMDMIGDDTGDNISEKNLNYCELTAQYWAWKNHKSEYIGFCHYRRYFEGITTIEDVEKYLANGKYDIVLTERSYESSNNAIRFEHLTTAEDLAILLDTIHRHYPDYYPTAIKYLYGSRRWVKCNMFIMRRSLFDDYAQWLFSILETAEKRCRLSSYSRMARLYGYMGEILLGIYVFHNKLKIKYVPSEDVGNDTRSTILNIKINIVRFMTYLNFLVQKTQYKDGKYISDATRLGLKNDGIDISC